MLLVMVTVSLLGCDAGARNRFQALLLLGKRSDNHHPGTYVDGKTPMDRIDEDFSEIGDE